MLSTPLIAAFNEADERIRGAQLHTVCGHLFPAERTAILANVARRHSVDLADLDLLMTREAAK
jgi:hypothetical protein